MIEITMTLVSARDGRRHDLGRAELSNVGGTADRAAYAFRILKAARYSARNAGRTWKLSRFDAADLDPSAGPDHMLAAVSGFMRRSKRTGPWALLSTALGAAVGDRVLPGCDGVSILALVDSGRALADIAARAASAIVVGDADAATAACNDFSACVFAAFRKDHE